MNENANTARLDAPVSIPALTTDPLDSAVTGLGSGAALEICPWPARNRRLWESAVERFFCRLAEVIGQRLPR